MKYLTFGGIGKILNSIDDESQIRLNLEQTIDDVIFKDIIKRYKIKKKQEFIKLIDYIFSINGNNFSVENIVNYYKNFLKLLISKKTVLNYLN
jgi:predicted AAA+ superfamily ATPase